MSTEFPHIPYHRPDVDDLELLSRARHHYQQMDQRRSVRFFSDRPVGKEVIGSLIMTAGTAPSGAHKQPWHFVAVSDPDVKRQIREAAEMEERAFYKERATEEWLRDLAPLGTDWRKPFLEIAPWLIIVFKKVYDDHPEGRRKNYYVQESVGIASGMLISAIHSVGLVTLTHTPSPMNFLSEILERPENEKPFLLLPVGFPASDATVPDLHRKKLEEIATFM